ncbi:Clp protease N-terminal domain-containing protein [Streptosporangium saharense]|uniref:Clp protease N-terminal domain-containing protein n=1 Tax=Streptosporangium saharense TaxID=1706840 RepID=UPI0034488232
MPKINVYLPDELAEAVKAAGVPVSAVCQRALEQAVRRITAIRETGLGSPGLDGSDARFASFTQRARTAMSLAIEEARAGGAAEVGTEHLLGGLLAEGTNLALHVLRAVEVDPGQVRRELDALGRSDTPATPAAPAAPARFGGPAAAALELTVTEAVALGHNYVGCEHLLLGLVAEPEGTAGRVLRGLGAEPRLARRAVTAALAGYVHLRAQHRSAGTDPLTEAVHRELRPFVQRLERLEERLGSEPPG